MVYKFCVPALILCGVACAQTQSSSNVEERSGSPAVRRISAGATLSVFILPPLKNNATSDIVTTNPALDAQYATTAQYHRIGYGVTAQIAITERIAAHGALIMRRAGYLFGSDVFTGTDNPNTIADERRHTVINEDTRARFYDLPVTVRYYSKDRHRKGVRWFAEVGPSWRRVSNIKSTIETTVNSGTTVTSTTPITPNQRTMRGVVAGFGVHAVDPIGIRVIPSVQYTRWMGETFKSFSTITQRNQVEAAITLSF